MCFNASELAELIGSPSALRGAWIETLLEWPVRTSDDAEGTNVVVLDPDVAEIFPNARAVNEALRTMARLVRKASKKPPRRRTA
jgi:hypothetical protein